jgi:hypothetical protein
MSRAALGFGLLVLLSVTLFLSAPARLLGRLLPADQIIMQGFNGTLWRGGASRCLLRTGSGYLHLGAVRWSLSPVSLLLAAPRLSLDSTWGDQVIAGELVVRGAQDIDLEEFEARVAADLLRQFAPVALTGTLSVQIERMQLRNGLPLQGSGRLVWQDGGWQAPRGLLPLGSYALDFQQAQGEMLEGRVLTLSGPVEASGTVRLQGRDYAVDILVSGRGLADDQLQQALALIAAPQGGDYRIELSGEF